jgi:hypothetical protein
MSDYWSESVYSDVEREAYSDWLRERPAPDTPSPSEVEESPYDWAFNAAEYRRANGLPEPGDPWAEDA